MNQIENRLLLHVLIVAMYNYIEEVDLLTKTFMPKVSFQGKKWWFPLFAFGKDAAF